MKNEIELPSLGLARRAGSYYVVSDPVSAATVGALVRQTWCRRVQVSDGTGGDAQFTALCEIGGQPFVVSGRISGGR